MPFFVPPFPLSVNIYRGPLAFPPVNPPAVTTTANLAAAPYAIVSTSQLLLLLPAGTDVRDFFNPSGIADYLECPIGTGRWYQVQFVDDFGKGFANEHRFAVVAKVGVWPVPYA